MGVASRPSTQALRNGLPIPREGPRALLVTFSIVGSEIVSCAIDLQGQGLSYVQSCYIDNSANMNPVTLTIAGTGQTITCLGQTQGFFPVLSGLGQLVISVATAGTVDIPCQFFNIPFDPITYSSVPASVVVTGVVPITGNVSAVQSGTWFANQGGTWNVGQSGAWTVAATQSGTWNVGQSGSWNVGQTGTWNVGQSGTWTVREQGAQQTSYGVSGPTQLVSGAARLWMVTVVVAGAGNGILFDSVGLSVNPICTIANTLGATLTFPGGIPLTTGLYALPGAGMALTIAY